ncbi:MAG: type II secretion system protein [Candidatus Sumerlaeota bacterium]|nr:type II secretion system protein [Candidatus Sumerlaeota bacterium]
MMNPCIKSSTKAARTCPFERLAINPHGRRAFSVLEVLIAVIIIGILAVLMVPTLSKRIEQSRISAAGKDLGELREALTRGAIDTGYYYPQHVLDDVLSVDPLAPDSIILENNNPQVVGAKRTSIFIDPKTGDFVPDAEAVTIWNRMTYPAGQPAERIKAVQNFGFKGSYLTWNRDKRRMDMQQDPWGNPYLFFTQKGMVWDYDDPNNLVPPSMIPPPAPTPNGTGLIQHQITLTWDYLTFKAAGGTACNVFDRCAVLSMGPNGMPGDITYPDFGKGDDIIIMFE